MLFESLPCRTVREMSQPQKGPLISLIPYQLYPINCGVYPPFDYKSVYHRLLFQAHDYILLVVATAPIVALMWQALDQSNKEMLKPSPPIFIPSTIFKGSGCTTSHLNTMFNQLLFDMFNYHFRPCWRPSVPEMLLHTNERKKWGALLILSLGLLGDRRLMSTWLTDALIFLTTYSRFLWLYGDYWLRRVCFHLPWSLYISSLSKQMTKYLFFNLLYRLYLYSLPSLY